MGLVCGILMGFSYTFTLALMWEVRWALIGFSQYLGAFISGGFSIILIGALAYRVREGVKKPWAIVTLVILAVVIIGGTYISIPRYRYSYGLNIMCTENTELLVPAAIATDGFSAKLVNYILTPAGNNPNGPDEAELIETKYGQMWHLKMTSHWRATPGQIGISSNFGQMSDELRSWQGQSLNNMIQLSSITDIRKVNVNLPDGVPSWPGFITDDYLVEQFKTPVKVRSENPAKFQLILYCSIERTSGLNFGYQKSEGYILKIEAYDGITGDDWVMVPVDVTNSVSVRGFGD
jgi:hypothetical protein